jgi:transcriptional regulator with XRE-family HTH domain
MATAELGIALRQWRDRIAPETAGLSSGGHRRAAGLRREELAQLAGISVDYITRLEQGRATHPSAQVVEALARALRLSESERADLFQLAGLAPPGSELISAYIPPNVQRMLDRLDNTPVAVFDAAWNQLLVNPLFTALMGVWHGNELNAAWCNFLGTRSRSRAAPDSTDVLLAAQVADLRATASRYPSDQRLRRLIAELHTSALFSELWESATVGRRESVRKTIDHPAVGPVTLNCDVLIVAGHDLRIMIYTAEPGTEDAERLELLSVIGSQSFS